jgi:hypothetical protein
MNSLLFRKKRKSIGSNFKKKRRVNNKRCQRKRRRDSKFFKVTLTTSQRMKSRSSPNVLIQKMLRISTADLSKRHSTRRRAFRRN